MNDVDNNSDIANAILKAFESEELVGGVMGTASFNVADALNNIAKAIFESGRSIDRLTTTLEENKFIKSSN
tara:strand:+ start:618 stop:830 length:213 start_codon:yes stop_codon:yes gene_type:complete